MQVFFWDMFKIYQNNNFVKELWTATSLNILISDLQKLQTYLQKLEEKNGLKNLEIFGENICDSNMEP